MSYNPYAGVTSFNTRQGAITLTYTDVTGALGYTPTTVAGAVSGVAAGVTGIIYSNGTALSAATAANIISALAYTPVSKAGDTFTGKVITLASATGGAGFNLPHGADPTAPVNGDMWTTTTACRVYLNGVTYGLALASGTMAITGAWSFSNTALTFGSSTAASTTNIASGATSTGNTKAVNVGTGGVAGSTTNATFGTVGGGTSNLLFHGTFGFTQAAETTKTTAATLTAAEIKTGIIVYTGNAQNLTTPTGTSLDSGFTQLVTDTGFDFSIINTGSGAATVVANTGITITGAAAVTNGTSGLFRLRKTGTATYTLYRLS